MRDAGQPERGFTLLELMITLAVAAILAGVAVPGFRELSHRNRLTAAVNALVGDLNYARGEAITRRRSVMMCKSINGNDCTEEGSWDQGWLVYAPEYGAAGAGNAGALRVHAPARQLHITGNAHVADTIGFNANGFAYDHGGASNGTLTVTSDALACGTREIVISNTGRVRTKRERDTDC